MKTITNKARKSYIITPKRDTNVIRMNDDSINFDVSEDEFAFMIVSDKVTRYLDEGEICVYMTKWGGECFGYEGDWNIEDGQGA